MRKTNTFGGAQGEPLTPANSTVGGTAFDTVLGTPSYDNGAIRFDGLEGLQALGWAYSTAASGYKKVGVRFDLLLPTPTPGHAVPPSGTYPEVNLLNIPLVQAANSTHFYIFLRGTTLYAGMGYTGVYYAIGSVSSLLGQWCRIEMNSVEVSGTSRWQVSIFANTTTATALSSYTGAASSWNPTSISEVVLGQSAVYYRAYNQAYDDYTYHMDNVEVNDTASFDLPIEPPPPPPPDPDPEPVPDVSTISGYSINTWNGIDHYGFSVEGSVLHFVDQEAYVSTFGEDKTHEFMTCNDKSGIEFRFALVNPWSSFQASLMNPVNSVTLSYPDNLPQVENVRGFRFYRDGAHLFREYIVEGSSTWESVSPNTELESGYDEDWQVQFVVAGLVDITEIEGFVYSPPGPDEDAPDVNDPYCPTCERPAVPTKTCMTVLDAIRQYSATVKRAIRIESANTISLVDPNEPYPTGWKNSDAADLYVGDTQVQRGYIGAPGPGLINLTASADLADDDARLIVSDWELPQRLPTEGVVAAAVQKVNYTVTPLGLTTDVEFYYPADLPAGIARISEEE